jgi:hypothetical protein
MQKSLFSSLKVIAMMLATDNELHPKEKAWFMAITKNYGATSSERSILQDYLSGRTTQGLEEILRDVVEDSDRLRLLKFVAMAMRQDGLVKNAEIKFFYQIQKVLEGGLQEDYQELARSILKHDKEMGVWKDLNRLGQAWSRNLPMFGISGHFYFVGAVFSQPFVDLLTSHKYKALFAIMIVVASFYWWI